MSKLYSSLAEKRENVIAIYTARHPSFVRQSTALFCIQTLISFSPTQVYSKPLIRKTRDAEAAEQSVKAPGPEAKAPEVEAKAPEARQEEAPVAQKVFIANPPRFMIALSRLFIGADEIDLSAANVEFNITDASEGTTMNAALIAGAHKIGMTIELSGGTWRAKTFSYNGNQKFRSAVPISAYDRKSFGCGDLRLADVVAKVEITLENVQIQPLFNPAADETLTAFSDHFNDCVGFFSPAIWGAIFVIILLMSIMSCGLTFILDIKSNDRFDDPKGKTITINAQE